MKILGKHEVAGGDNMTKKFFYEKVYKFMYPV
jgi:hypothetical protein